MPHTAEGWISTLATVFVCLWALVRGERPERIAAFALIATTAATVWSQDRIAWIDPERRILTIDAALFAVFACLASITQRRWVIAATGFQLLALVLHFLALFHRGFSAYAYLTGLAGMAYGIVAALGFGVWQVERARRAERAPEPA